MTLDGPKMKASECRPELVSLESASCTRTGVDRGNGASFMLIQECEACAVYFADTTSL